MPIKPFDPTLKALVETVPADWPVLAGQPRAPTTVIDADIATVSGAADKVLHVQAAIAYLLHLEFQAGHDSASLPPLLHVRNALLNHRHDLSVRSVAVLLRPEADSPALTGERRQGFPGEEPIDVFRYQIIRVWRLSPERLLAGGIGTLPLAPISAVTEAELPAIIEKMEERLARSRPRRQTAEEMWGATLILLGLRYSRDLARELMRRVRSMRESVTYQMILEEGRSEGALAEAMQFLLRIGENRFGSPDEATRAALEDIEDVRRLEELGVRLLHVNSWQELFERPAARRPTRRR